MLPEQTSDLTPIEHWVDHRMAAEQWGIGLDSARLKLKRYGWPTRTDKIGKRWYKVPEHYRFSARPSDEQSVDGTDNAPSASLRIDHQPLTDAVARLTDELTRANARADVQQWRADEAQRGMLEAQAALEQERRERAEELRATRDERKEARQERFRLLTLAEVALTKVG